MIGSLFRSQVQTGKILLDSHKRLDLQLTTTSLAHQAKASSGSDTQEKEATTAEKEVKLRPKAIELLLGSDSPGSSVEDSDPVQDEVEDYFKQLQQPRDSSPLEWWKVNQCRFPTLAGLARKYLVITATSTPAEQVFSVAGLIVSRLRDSLTPEHVDMLVFLNKVKSSEICTFASYIHVFQTSCLVPISRIVV